MRFLLICLLFLSAFSEAALADRSLALIFQPARASDADKVAQLRKLMATVFADRNMPIMRFLANYDPARLAEAREFLKTGRAIIAQDVSLQRTEDAEKALTQALFGFKSVLGEAGVEEVAEVYRGLALTRLVVGDRKLAAAYLRTSMLVGPEQIESKYRASNAFLELFKEQKLTIPVAPIGAIRVESSPAGSEVYLGDELKGFTPMTLGGLKAGGHLVRLKRDGYYTHGWLVDVDGKNTRRLNYKLKPVPGNSRHEGWIKALHTSSIWKDPAAVLEAMSGLRRVYKCTDVIVVKARWSRKGVRLSGAVGPAGVASHAVKADVPIDANLLERVKSLSKELIP